MGEKGGGRGKGVENLRAVLEDGGGRKGWDMREKEVLGRNEGGEQG